MQTALTNLDDAFTRVTTAQTRVGVAMNSIEAEQSRIQDTKLAGNARHLASPHPENHDICLYLAHGEQYL